MCRSLLVMHWIHVDSVIRRLARFKAISGVFVNWRLMM